MKVKVSTRQLIQMVQDSKKRLRAEYAERVAAYPAQVETYREQLIRALERELARQRKGGTLPEHYCRYRNGSDVEAAIIDVGSRPPAKPVKPDTKRHDHRLRELRLETREELLVDVRDREWLGVL